MSSLKVFLLKQSKPFSILHVEHFFIFEICNKLSNKTTIYYIKAKSPGF